MFHGTNFKIIYESLCFCYNKVRLISKNIRPFLNKPRESFNKPLTFFNDPSRNFHKALAFLAGKWGKIKGE
jgi:hypothetical protein